MGRPCLRKLHSKVGIRKKSPRLVPALQKWPAIPDVGHNLLVDSRTKEASHLDFHRETLTLELSCMLRVSLGNVLGGSRHGASSHCPANNQPLM